MYLLDDSILSAKYHQKNDRDFMSDWAKKEQLYNCEAYYQNKGRIKAAIRRIEAVTSRVLKDIAEKINLKAA